METTVLIEKAQNALSELAKVSEISALQPEVLNVWIESTKIKEAVQIAVDEKLGYLVTITALDGKDEAGNPVLDLIYHLSEDGMILNIRCSVPQSDAVIDSICDVIPSATIYERECIELFGVDMKDTPDRQKLLLPDEWPDGLYPMLKSFTPDKNGKWQTERIAE